MTKIISIHSFRGGTGKSNFTANIASLLALNGKRVGVIDTDIQSPGIHVLFGLDETNLEYTLNDYLWGKCDIQKTAYDCTQILQKELGENKKIEGAVFLIPSSIKVNEIAQILSDGYDVDLLNQGFLQLNETLKLDYLLIDTHPGLNEETIVSIGLSDLTLIILRPDYQDYQGTAVTVEVAKELDVPELMLVVNKVLPDLDFEALKDNVEITYNTPVTAILPICNEMIRLASQSIFSLRYPNHPFTKELEKIVKKIQGE
jgi:MinD-like ATPase involved in chromosome partitioning or flagellar assembly